MLAFALSAASASADIVLSGANFITKSTEISEKVTGTGYYVVKQGATLTLSNPANDFTGGVIVTNGLARATASGAFGTGPVILDYKNRQVEFAADQGVYPNDVIVRYSGTGSDYPILFSRSGALTGDLVNETAQKIYLKANAADVTMTFAGDVVSPNGAIYNASAGKAVFRGRIRTTSLSAGVAAEDVGETEIWNPSNAVDKLIIRKQTVALMATNVLRNACVQWSVDGLWPTASQSRLLLNGHDQRFSEICGTVNDVYGEVGYETTGMAVATAADRPAVVTLTGGSAATTAQVNLHGPVSLAVAHDPEVSAQACARFTHRKSSSTGSLAVRDGRFCCEQDAQFAGTTRLTVDATGEIAFASVSNPLPALRTATIAGKVTCDAACQNVLGSKTALHLSPDAVLTFPSGTRHTVRSLTVGNRVLPAGTYSRTNLPQMVTSGETAELVVTSKACGFRSKVY